MFCFSFKLAYPSSSFVSRVSFTFAMIVPIEWREQIKVQVKIHPSLTGVDWISKMFLAVLVL